MNFKSTIFLLVLLLGVGLYFFYVDRQHPTTFEVEKQNAQQGDAVGQALLAGEQALDSEQVVTVELVQGDKKAVFVKENADWRQTQPVAFAVNSWSLSDLARAIAELRYVDKFEPGQNQMPALDKLGLDKPYAAVTLHTAAANDKPARQITLRLGKTFSAHTYVQLDQDSSVYVAGTDLTRQIPEQAVNEWRKKNVTAPGEGAAQQLRLEYEGVAIGLLKSGNNWSFAPPYSGRGSSTAVAELLSAVGGLFINEFAADQPKDLSLYGLDKPSTVLRIESSVAQSLAPPSTQPAATAPAEKPSSVTLLHIGAAKGLKDEYYFASIGDQTTINQVVFTLGADAVKKLRKSVDDLRDKRLTPLAAGDISALSIAPASGSAVSLEHALTGWKFALGGPAYLADDQAVADLVNKITSAQATAFVPDAKPAAAALASVTLTAIGQPQPDVLQLFAGPDKQGKAQVLVLRNNETTGYLLAKDQLAAVFAGPLALRDRVAVRLAGQQIEKLSVTLPAELGGKTLAFSRALPPPAATTQPADAAAPGPWQLAGEERFEQAALESLLRQLTPLTAENWLDQPAGPPVGKRLFALQAQQQNGINLNLTFDADTRHAWVTGVDRPFVLSPAAVVALTAELRQRTVLEQASSDMLKVVVVDKQGSLTIDRDEAGKYSSPDQAALDEAAAGSLFDGLAGLRGEHFVAAPPQPIVAQRSFEITGKDGAAHKLTLLEGVQVNGRPVAQLGERFFTLEEATAKKLTAELLKK